MISYIYKKSFLFLLFSYFALLLVFFVVAVYVCVYFVKSHGKSFYSFGEFFCANDNERTNEHLFMFLCWKCSTWIANQGICLKTLFQEHKKRHKYTQNTQKLINTHTHTNTEKNFSLFLLIYAKRQCVCLCVRYAWWFKTL